MEYIGNKHREQEYRVKRLIVIMLIITMACNVYSVGYCKTLNKEVAENNTGKDKRKKNDIKASYETIYIGKRGNKVVTSHNADKKIYPASTVKILTVIVMLDKIKEKKLTGEEYIKVTDKVLKTVDYGSHMAYIGKDKQFRYNDLLKLVLVNSAADAVKVLEKSLFGNQKNLVKAMNSKAKEIGMSKSHFDNGIGLDIGNGYTKTYSTAHDMCLLGAFSYKYKFIRDTAKLKRCTVIAKGNKQHITVRSTNKFYYTEGYNKKKFVIIGTKTGYTNAAGSTLIATAKDKKGNIIVGAVYNVPKDEKVYTDMRIALEAAFSKINF